MNPEFLSGEASASPAVEPLLEGARRLARLGFGAGALAARNGLRTTTHANLPFEMLQSGDFIEVADYDPHLDRLMMIGKRDANPHAGMLSLMLRAKKEVGGIVLLDASAAKERFASLPHAKRGETQLDNALAALEALRGTDAATWGAFLVATGRTPEEAVARAASLVEGSS